MEWNRHYPQHLKPSMDQMADYIGGQSRILWNDLIKYMQKSYDIKPKMTYST